MNQTITSIKRPTNMTNKQRTNNTSNNNNSNNNNSNNNDNDNNNNEGSALRVISMAILGQSAFESLQAANQSFKAILWSLFVIVIVCGLLLFVIVYHCLCLLLALFIIVIVVFVCYFLLSFIIVMSVALFVI